MTRLLATGDLHLGAGLLYGDDRIADQARVLAQIAAIAKSNDVDAVLVAGDVFHRAAAARRRAPHLPRVHRRPHRARHPRHRDHRQQGPRHRQRRRAVRARALRRRHRPRPRLPDVDTIGGVAVACLPNVPVDRLVALRGGRDDDVNAEAVALLDPDGRRASRADPRGDAGGAARPLVGDGGVPAERAAVRVADTEPVLPLDALEGQGWDAVVLGHCTGRS
jgi:hypothetical protein